MLPRCHEGVMASLNFSKHAIVTYNPTNQLLNADEDMRGQ